MTYTATDVYHSANLDFQIFHTAAVLYSYDVGCRFHSANHNLQCQYMDQIYSSDGLLDGEMIELAWKTSAPKLEENHREMGPGLRCRLLDDFMNNICVSIFFPLLPSVNKVSLRPNCERLQALHCIYRSFTPSCFCGHPFVPRID